MKRSNRLVLLIGLFLAIVAGALVLFTFRSGGTGPGASAAPTTADVVVAAQDIALGATIQAEDVGIKSIPIANKPADSYADVSFVIGQVARQPVTKDQLITSAILTGTPGKIGLLSVPTGYVAISVMVDQVTGVGTIVKPGDFVDIVTAITIGGEGSAGLVYEPEESPPPRGFLAEELPLNPTTVKTLVQGAQVLGTLLPPAPSSGNATPAPSAATGGTTTTTLNGQQQIVVLAVSLQDAEVIRFNQVGGSISLVLRSSKDCKTPDPNATPAPSPSGVPAPSASPETLCPIIPTTGITLRRLVDDRGVLPPTVVEVIQPTPYPK